MKSILVFLVTSMCLALSQKEAGQQPHHLVAKSMSVKAVNGSFHGASSEGRARWESWETKLDYLGRDMKKVNMTAFTGNKTDMTFKQRYYIDDQYFNSDRAIEENLPRPILFYAGNEAAADAFYNQTGFIMQTMAKKYGGLVVIGELRYYGDSKPFGNQSYLGQNGQYADMGNIIFDFVSLIQHIKTEYGAEKSPVLATGGSYGGQIASFMRFKYPEIVQMAINSGGPHLYQRLSPASPEEFYNLYLPSIYDRLGDLPDGK